MSDVKVFVSYSWRIPESVRIVDDLDKPASERQIRLLRDKKELKVGEYISEFMQQIAEAEHAIVVLSKPYFESEYCFWELLHLFLNKGFEQQVYPILADDIDLKATSEVVAYWKKQRDALQAEVDRDGAGNVPDKVKKLNLFKKFVIEVDSLMSQVGDILAAQSQTFGQGDYSGLLDLISKIPEIPRDAIFQPPSSDKEFMAKIKERLKASLDESDTLRRVLAEQFDAKGEQAKSAKLVEELIDLCGNNLDELLSDDIRLPVREALKRLSSGSDNDSPQVVKEVDQLTRGADALFSCLVLYAIQESWMVDYCQGCSVAASNLRQMPFGAAATVEVVTSRHLQRLPSFELTPSEALGKEGIQFPELGFKKDDVVTGVLSEIWVKVFPEERRENFRENKLKRLGNLIKTRHKSKDTEKSNYYCVVPDDPEFALNDPVIRAELMRKLPQLPLIVVSSEECEDALIVSDDEDLASYIFEFHQDLNKYRPYEPEKDNRRPSEN